MNKLSDFDSFPTNEDIVNFIRYYGSPVTRKNIADNFGIKGDERRELRAALNSLRNEGVIIKQAKFYSVIDRLPSVTMVEITEINVDGDVFAKPVEWDEDIQGSFPIIEITPDKKGFATIKEKDRALVRLTYITDRSYEARIIKKIEVETGSILGVVQYEKRRYILKPTSKKAKHDYDIPPIELNGAKDGDLAIGVIMSVKGLKNKQVRIDEIIGKEDDPAVISLIALHENSIRNKFPKEVLTFRSF